AEHRGMVDPEMLARARERSRLGDRLDIAEIVPRHHTAAPSPLLLRTRGMTANPTPFPARTQACRRDTRMVEASFCRSCTDRCAKAMLLRCFRNILPVKEALRPAAPQRPCANRWRWTCGIARFPPAPPRTVIDAA